VNKFPEVSIILAQEGESITLQLKSQETKLDQNPVFLFNGSTEYVGQVMGAHLKNQPGASYSTSVSLEESGDHVAHAIWTPKGELNLENIDVIDEVRSAEQYEMVEWTIHVLPQSSTLDDVRQVIDDLTRAGTVAWVGKTLLEKINDWTSDEKDEEDSDGKAEIDDKDQFQEVLSNYE